MSVVVVSGSGGLVGSEAASFYAGQASQVVGIDNDMRARFFGPEASTDWAVKQLRESLDNYVHHGIDIRDVEQSTPCSVTTATTSGSWCTRRRSRRTTGPPGNRSPTSP